MIQPEKLFENCFDSIRITPLRFSNFALDTVTRFNNVDVSGTFKAATAAIVAAYSPFHEGLSEIDTSKGEKKGKTKNVNEVRTSFGDFMGEYQNEIARALGGRDASAFISFYPKGVMEYTKATKLQMPLLVKRISKLATDNAAALGAALATQLQAFATLWDAALEEESAVKSTLSDGRADRGTLRTNLEKALLTAIHLVAAQYPRRCGKMHGVFRFWPIDGCWPQRRRGGCCAGGSGVVLFF